MEWLLDPGIWAGLITLTVLEVVLGIDNIVFISILASRLPKERQLRAWRVGLFLAMFTRILLLLSLGWVMRLQKPLFTVLGFAASGRDIILIAGGLFLIAKSTVEIHHKLEGHEESHSASGPVSFSSVITQIVMLDIIFSLDSVITAVGMVREIPVMIAAVVIAVMFMMAAANTISTFIHNHPTIKMLALAFLVLIGVNLMAEGFHQHIERGYTYFAMAFSVAVEMLNMRIRPVLPVSGSPVKSGPPAGGRDAE